MARRRRRPAPPRPPTGAVAEAVDTGTIAADLFDRLLLAPRCSGRPRAAGLRRLRLGRGREGGVEGPSLVEHQLFVGVLVEEIRGVGGAFFIACRPLWRSCRFTKRQTASGAGELVRRRPSASSQGSEFLTGEASARPETTGSPGRASRSRPATGSGPWRGWSSPTEKSASWMRLRASVRLVTLLVRLLTAEFSWLSAHREPARRC